MQFCTLSTFQNIMLERGNSLSCSRTPLCPLSLFLPLFLGGSVIVRCSLSYSLLRPSARLRMPLCFCVHHLICCVPAQRAPHVRLLSHVRGMHSAWKIVSLPVFIASKNGNDILFIFSFELTRFRQLKRLREFNIRPTNRGQSVWKGLYQTSKVERKTWDKTTFPGV